MIIDYFDVVFKYNVMVFRLLHARGETSKIRTTPLYKESNVVTALGTF